MTGDVCFLVLRSVGFCSTAEALDDLIVFEIRYADRTGHQLRHKFEANATTVPLQERTTLRGTPRSSAGSTSRGHLEGDMCALCPCGKPYSESLFHSKFIVALQRALQILW